MIFLSVGSVTKTVLAVILAILILLAMVTVHEFGHYLAGKIFKFKINEFAIGFGPALFKKKSKKSGEIFSLRLFPLGGYCAFEGEDKQSELCDSFNKKSPWKRIIVLVAGAFMNYLTAIILLIICFCAFGQMTFKVNSVVKDEAYPTEYSLADGDLVLKAQGKGVYLTNDLMTALHGKNAGDTVIFTVAREDGTHDIEVILRDDCDFSSSSDTSKLWRAIGVDTETRDDGKLYWAVGVESYKMPFFTSVGHAFVYSGKIAGTIFKVLGELLTGKIGLSAMGGPVTTIKLTSQIASQSVQSFLEIAAYIGVNLAVFNLLPIPALDGSKVVFVLIEWIFKKPVPRKIEAVIHAVGFALILLFAVIVDILQFI